MKFALSLASLVALTNAAVVYKTEHYHVTVTAGDQNVASIAAPSSTQAPPPPPPPASSSAAPAPAPKEEDNNNVQQNAKVQTIVTTLQAQQQQKAATPTSQGEAVSQKPNPTATGDTDLDEYAKKVIDRHNNDRSKHSAGSLAWNETLASYAKKYLENQNCVFAHSGGPYGENIAMGYNSAEDAIKAWYEEYKNYNYQAAQFSEDTGHFTQMVWKDSTQVGCADVDCGSKGTFMACEYFPRGNIVGQFVDNVLSS